MKERSSFLELRRALLISIRRFVLVSLCLTLSMVMGCSDDEPTIAEPILVESEVKNIACFGDTAAIDITIEGGKPPYTILWEHNDSNFSSTSEDLVDLIEPGVYSVDITDQLGINAKDSFEVFENEEIIMTFSQGRPNAGVNNGTLEIEIEGGQPPYEVVWDDVRTGQVIDGLSSGWHTARVTDAEGCTAESSTLLYGVFTDSRDQKEYKTIKIGSQVWMAENLKAATTTTGEAIPKFIIDWYSSEIHQPYRWGDDICRNCNWYNWYTINAYTTTLCPEGWKIPSDEEWWALVETVGENPGIKLKDRSSSIYWYQAYDDRYGEATNESGFTAHGAGTQHDNTFDQNQGSVALWWTTTANSDPIRANVFVLQNLSNNAFVSSYNKEYGANCRCIME